MQTRPTSGRHRVRALVVAVALVMIALAVYFAGRSPGSMLGAHALVGQLDMHAESVARTPPLDTARTGSALLMFVGGYSSNDAVPTDTYRNRWQPLAPAELYRGYDGRFDLHTYLAPAAKGGPGHVFQIDKPGVPTGELTLVALEVRNAGRLIAATHTYPAAGYRISSGTVTTDGPALLVATWWGDGRGTRHYAQPDNGFRVIERFTRLPDSAVQAEVAVRHVDRAGTYRVNWYNVPRQGAILWLLAFAPRAKG